MCDEIRLVRHDLGETPWGFRITGGRDFGTPLLVVKVIGGSIAALAGVQVGDLVRGINYVPTNDFTHLDAQRAILESGDTLILNLLKAGEYELPVFDIQSPEDKEVAFIAEDLESSFMIKLDRSGRISAVEELPTPSPSPRSSPELRERSSSISGSDKRRKSSSAEKVTISDTEKTERKPKISITVSDGPVVIQPPSYEDATKSKSAGRKESLKEQPQVTFHEEMRLETSLKKTTTEIKERTEEEFVHGVREQIVAKAHQENRELTDDEIAEMMAGEAEVLEGQKGQEVIGVNFQKFLPKCDFIKDSEVFKKCNKPEPEKKRKDSSDKCLSQKQRVSIDESGRRSKTKKVGFVGSDFKEDIERQLSEIQNELLKLQQLPIEIQGHLLVVQRALQDIVSNRSQSPESDESTKESGANEDDVDDEQRTDCTSEVEVPAQDEEPQEAEEDRDDADDKTEDGDAAEKTEETDTSEGTLVEPESSDNLVEVKLDEQETTTEVKETPKDLPHGQEDVEMCVAKKRPALPLTPQMRPLVLPGGKKWLHPRDAYTEDYIAETLVSQSEVLVGTTIGVNFRKYIPPKFDSYNSAVCRLVHEIEERTDLRPKQGISERPEIVPGLDAFYHPPIDKRHFYAAQLAVEKKQAESRKSESMGSTQR